MAATCKSFDDFMQLALRARVDENKRQCAELETWLRTVKCGQKLRDNFWTKKAAPIYHRWIWKKVAALVNHETAFINWTAIEKAEGVVEFVQSREDNSDLMFVSFLLAPDSSTKWGNMIKEAEEAEQKQKKKQEQQAPALADVLDATAQAAAAKGANFFTLDDFDKYTFEELLKQVAGPTSTPELSLSKEVVPSQNQRLLYLEITAQNLCEAGIPDGQLQRHKTRVRQFMEDKVEAVGMDPQQIKYEISSECEWSYRFEGKWDCSKAELLQEELITSYQMRFGVSELAGNCLRVEKKCYRVVVRGSLKLFEAFQQQEEQFHEDMAGRLPEGIERAKGARAQLNRVFVTVRCPETVRNRLMAAKEGPPAKKQKQEGKAAEEEGSVEVTVQPMDGASFGVMLEEGDGSNSNVRALKAKIEKVDGAACERQELFMLLEGEEAKSEEPLSDDFEFESACTVALCVRPEAEWEWSAASELVKDGVFALSGENNSIATNIGGMSDKQ